MRCPVTDQVFAECERWCRARAMVIAADPNRAAGNLARFALAVNGSLGGLLQDAEVLTIADHALRRGWQRRVREARCGHGACPSGRACSAPW